MKTLSDVINAIDEMHDELITSYETVAELETELENKE